MRGRPRKAGRRYSSGRLIAIADPGTDETRQNLAVTCGSPLGWLLSRQAITPQQHNDGVRFAMLFRMIWGRNLSPRSNLGQLGEGGYLSPGAPLVDAPETAGAAVEIALRGALRALGPDQKLIVDVAVYDETPPQRTYPALRRGLDALAEHWRHRR